MRSIINCLFVLIFTGSASFAINIEVSDSSAPLRSKLITIADKLSSNGLTTDPIIDSLGQFLNRLGYFDASFDLQNEQIIVSPGSQTSLQSLIINGKRTDTKSINEPFDQQIITALTKRMIDSLEIEGHYYARINIDSVVRTGFEADLFLTMIPGPVVIVSRVQAEGLKSSDPTLVEQILSQSINSQLTARKLTEFEKRANQISWLEFMAPVEVLPHPGYQSVDLRFNFYEKKRFTFFGGFGYQSADNTGLIWQLAAAMRSPFGRGRVIKLNSERRDAGNQFLEIEYRQPSFWLGDGEFGLDLLTRDFRAQFSEFGLKSYLDFRLDYKTTWGTTLGYKRVEPSDLQTGHSRYTVGLEINRSTTSHQFNPVSGYQLQMSLVYAHRRYSDDSLAIVPDQLVYNDTRLAAALELFSPIGRTIVLRSAVGYEGLESDEKAVPLSELVMVGGKGSLRGYRNDRFAARRVGLVSFEPRFQFESGYLFLFYDGALMGLDQLVQESYRLVEKYRHGFGLGFALTGKTNRVAIAFGWQPELALDQPRLNIELSADL